MEMQQILILMVVMALAVTVMIYFAERGDKKKPPRKAHANVNTGAAAKVLKSYAARNDCRVLGPLTLTKGERTVTLDCVLVGWFGVLGVKSLGYNGQVYGNPKDAQWLWSSTGKRENFPNPINDCALAARLMREALMQAGVRNPDSEAVYVFTDSKVELFIPRDAGAMKLADLRSLLRKDKYHTDKGHDLDKMCQALAPFEAKPE